MRVLLAVYSKDNSAKNAAFCLQDYFKAHDFDVDLEYVLPVKKLKEYEYSKLETIELKNKRMDVSAYNLIIIGTSVFSAFPSPVIVSYIKCLEGLGGKNIAVYCTCILPGTVIKTLSSLLTSRGAHVIDSLAIKSLFEINTTKLPVVEKFAEKVLRKLVSPV